MTNMTCRRIVCLSWLLISLSNAWAWVLPASPSIKSSRRVCRFSTPNDQESEEKVTSFDEAGQGLRDEEDNRRMEEAGDFDSNPAYSSDNIDKMRAAIRARTEEMGLEKAKLSKQIIQEANQRARAGERVQGLDLSQIRGNLPEGMPSVLYDPEDEMTDEEKKGVDPVGQMSIIQQFQNELTNAKWPQPMAALKEVAIMFVVVAATGALIIFWDRFLRDTYTNFGLIPSSDAIKMRFDGLELPEGWTNMMSEDDIANLPQGIRDGAGTTSKMPDL